MSASRARKIMLAAIAISVLLHLILAGYVPWPFNRPSPEEAIVKVRRITIARAVHRPPPTPPPRPLPTPRPSAAAVKAKVAAQHVTVRSKGPPVAHAVVPSAGAGRASAAPATLVPTPSPAAPAAQACLQHDISPAVAANAQPAEIPPEARASRTNGTAAIQVQIDPKGHVTDASVARSSGNAGLDAVAMEMAKGATYTPALVKCKPVASAYTFTVKFAPW